MGASTPSDLGFYRGRCGARTRDRLLVREVRYQLRQTPSVEASDGPDGLASAAATDRGGASVLDPPVFLRRSRRSSSGQGPWAGGHGAA